MLHRTAVSVTTNVCQHNSSVYEFINPLRCCFACPLLIWFDCKLSRSKFAWKVVDGYELVSDRQWKNPSAANDNNNHRNIKEKLNQKNLRNLSRMFVKIVVCKIRKSTKCQWRWSRVAKGSDNLMKYEIHSTFLLHSWAALDASDVKYWTIFDPEVNSQYRTSKLYSYIVFASWICLTSSTTLKSMRSIKILWPDNPRYVYNWEHNQK